MVEHSLSMRGVQGSIPWFSTTFFVNFKKLPHFFLEVSNFPYEYSVDINVDNCTLISNIWQENKIKIVWLVCTEKTQKILSEKYDWAAISCAKEDVVDLTTLKEVKTIFSCFRKFSGFSWLFRMYSYFFFAFFRIKQNLWIFSYNCSYDVILRHTNE